MVGSSSFLRLRPPIHPHPHSRTRRIQAMCSTTVGASAGGIFSLPWQWRSRRCSRPGLKMEETGSVRAGTVMVRLRLCVWGGGGNGGR